MIKIRLIKSLIVFVSFLYLTGCKSSNDSSNAEAPTQQTGTEVGTVVQTNQTVEESQKSDLVKNEKSDSGVSEDLKVDWMDIKRLNIGSDTMELLNPNPENSNSIQTGTLFIALCGLRISEANFSQLENVDYPFILSENSQVLIRRDNSYQFGDGTNSSSLAGFSLITCGLQVGSNLAPLNSKLGNDKVQVTRLRVTEVAMEVFNPNPRRSSGLQQNGSLVLILCSDRITDKNINNFQKSVYPIIISKGSQIGLRRDNSYQFGDGSNAKNLPPEVVITCE